MGDIDSNKKIMKASNELRMNILLNMNTSKYVKF